MSGAISYFNLDEWFEKTFSQSEREYMSMKYGAQLVKGNYSSNYDSKACFLADLSSWFNTKENYDLCVRIIHKAEEFAKIEKTSLLNMHFYYNNLIRFFYKNRDICDNFQKAIDNCKKQIAIAKDVKKEFLNNELLNTEFGLPSHTGFEQLVIIEKKKKNWSEVIKICEEAKKQGWSGDWDKRICEAQNKALK